MPPRIASVSAKNSSDFRIAPRIRQNTLRPREARSEVPAALLGPRGRPGNITLPVNIVVTDSSYLDLNGFSDTVGSITLIGGEIDTGTGTITITEDLLEKAQTLSKGNPIPRLDGSLAALATASAGK